MIQIFLMIVLIGIHLARRGRGHSAELKASEATRKLAHLQLTSAAANSQHRPLVAVPHSGRVPCRLLCNRLDFVLIHVTRLRATGGVGSGVGWGGTKQPASHF